MDANEELAQAIHDEDQAVKRDRELRACVGRLENQMLRAIGRSMKARRVLAALVEAVSADELMPESVSFMQDARAVLSEQGTSGGTGNRLCQPPAEFPINCAAHRTIRKEQR